MPDGKRALEMHAKRKGKIEVVGSVSMRTKEELSEYYTPGVAQVSLAINKDRAKAYDYTMKGRMAAILTDGTRILGLGDIGPEAGMPVMEGKALLLKKLGGVDAIPVCLDTKDEAQILRIAKALEPNFAAMNIEDIETPKCLNIVERLSKEMGIPIFHDDRNGVAVVTLAALTNALKLAGKKLRSARIVVNGAGAAGIGIAELLVKAGAERICLCDTSGILYKGRAVNMNLWKVRIAAATNREMMKGTLSDAVKGADVLIGASVEGAFTAAMIRSMAKKPVAFSLANPYPEMDYQEMLSAGAFIAATGRSDRPNQVNNLLAFPGIMAGLIESRASRVDGLMLVRSAEAIARFSARGMRRDRIIADPIGKNTVLGLAPKVAAAVAESALELGIARSRKSPNEVELSVSKAIKRYSKIERVTSR
ncbi:MAG: NADP-dependent malic enzyme [Candidatus Micrarchaeota archaeon]|nr:NADP-dependent malic enzyme [Candidatus Micrarchaeota archaeon]